MDIAGLPLHPLVVHAVVILVPLAAVVDFAFALLPGWRWLTRWAALLLTAGAVVSVFVARSSGASFLDSKPFLLEEGTKTAELMADHQDYARVLWFVSLALLVVVIAAFILLPAPTGLASGKLDHAGNSAAWVVRGLPVLLVVLGLAAMVYAVLTGDAGARAVWGS